MIEVLSICVLLHDHFILHSFGYLSVFCAQLNFWRGPNPLERVLDTDYRCLVVPITNLVRSTLVGIPLRVSPEKWLPPSAMEARSGGPSSMPSAENLTVCLLGRKMRCPIATQFPLTSFLFSPDISLRWCLPDVSVDSLFYFSPDILRTFVYWKRFCPFRFFWHFFSSLRTGHTVCPSFVAKTTFFWYNRYFYCSWNNHMALFSQRCFSSFSLPSLSLPVLNKIMAEPSFQGDSSVFFVFFALYSFLLTSSSYFTFFTTYLLLAVTFFYSSTFVLSVIKSKTNAITSTHSKGFPMDFRSLEWQWDKSNQLFFPKNCIVFFVTKTLNTQRRVKPCIVIKLLCNCIIFWICAFPGITLF